MRQLIQKALALFMVADLLSGCAAERLRDNTGDAGAITTDVTYQMVLSNIAMLRYYNHAAVLPADYHLTGGQVAVNDSVGITAGATLGSPHGIIAPNISVPTSRILQQSLNLSITNNVIILDTLRKMYWNEEHYHGDLFHSGGLPPLGASRAAIAD